jgi:hypothetical protein
MFNNHPSIPTLFPFYRSNTITSPACFSHKMTIFKGRLNVKGQRSRYSDYLWAGQPKGQSLRPGRIKNFLHMVQISSEVHPTSYAMGTGGSFPGGEATTHLHLVPRSRKCGSIHPLPHMPSWCSA